MVSLVSSAFSEREAGKNFNQGSLNYFVIYATLTNGWESGTPQFIIILMSLLTLVETMRPLFGKNRKLAQIAIAVLVLLFVLGTLIFYFLR